MGGEAIYSSAADKTRRATSVKEEVEGATRLTGLVAYVSVKVPPVGESVR